MRLVVIEHPCAALDVGTRAHYRQYALLCMQDALKRGEAPYSSVLLFDQPGLLDDLVPEERLQGIQAGLAWAARAEVTAVYTDYGISKGMQQGIDQALQMGRPIEYRALRRAT